MSSFLSVCFTNDGGPLIALPQEALIHWEGTKAPSNGRIVHAKSRWLGGTIATDYDRASDVTYLSNHITVGEGWGTGIITVGDSWGFVIGDPPNARWLITSQATYILSIVYVEREDYKIEANRVSTFISYISFQDWFQHGTVEVVDEYVSLLHSANTGKEVNESKQSNLEFIGIGNIVSQRFRPSRYLISTAELKVPNEGHFVFHRFSDDG